MDIKLLEFMDHLYEFETNTKAQKKVFDVITATPKEKEGKSHEKSEFTNIKHEIANFIHKQYIYDLKELIRNNNIPDDVKKKWEQFMVPLNKIPDELSKRYATKIVAVMAIFKKYVHLKQDIAHKDMEIKNKEINLATVKMMISAGKTLEEIGDRFNMPASTLAQRLKNQFQTSYTNIKHQMGK